MSVPLADSVSAVKLLLYSHATPAALKSELRVTRMLAFSTLVPPTDSAVHKEEERLCIEMESDNTQESIVLSML